MPPSTYNTETIYGRCAIWIELYRFILMRENKKRKATCITQVCQETNPRAVTNSVVNIRERNNREETYDMNFKGQGPGDRRSVPQCFGILEETSPSTTSYPPGQFLQEHHV